MSISDGYIKLSTQIVCVAPVTRELHSDLRNFKVFQLFYNATKPNKTASYIYS